MERKSDHIAFCDEVRAVVDVGRDEMAGLGGEEGEKFSY